MIPIPLQVLSFLKSPLGRYLMIGLAVLGLLVGVHHAGVVSGVTSERKAHQRALEAAQRAVQKHEAASIAISAKTDQKLAEQQVKIQTVTRTLIEKVPTYVNQDPLRLNVSNGFVRLYNASALGVSEVPNGSGGTDDQPSTVTDASILTTTIGNYGICHDTETRLALLQDWVRQQASNP